MSSNAPFPKSSPKSHGLSRSSMTSSLGPRLKDSPQRNVNRRDADLQLYMQEARRTDLLSAEEEVQLGWKRINEQCATSRERLIRANIRLVVSIARSYAGRGLSMSDLIAEGNLSLVHAVDGFDPSRGVRFATYASWWIKNSLKRALLNPAQVMHVPAYMIRLIAKWKVAFHKLQLATGETPTLQEVATEMDLPLRQVRIIRHAVRQFHASTTPGRGSSGDLVELGQIITDSRAEAPGERLLRTEELRVLQTLLDRIDIRDAQVLRMRFGLNGEEPSTLREIANSLGLSGESVRQILSQALKSLNAGLTYPHDRCSTRGGVGMNTAENDSSRISWLDGSCPQTEPREKIRSAAKKSTRPEHAVSK
jgi:RNA polymerase primary sigma factor